MKSIRFWLLATTALVAVQPSEAQAQPPAIAAIGAVAGSAIAAGTVLGYTVLAGLLGAFVTLGSGLLANVLSGGNRTSGAQSDQRTRQYDPHPPFRFAFGEFPLEGVVVFHHTVGQAYYMVLLLNSVRSEAVTSVTISDGVELEFADISDATDFSADHNPTNAPWSDFAGTKDAAMNLHIGLGDQTAPPDRWLSEIGPGGIYSDGAIRATDSWKGSTVAFLRWIHGGAERAARRWATGKPPSLRFMGQWAKVYDPRLDSSSGVSGASGSHDPDDATTWAWSSNPALCGLMLVRHQYALGFDDEMIPIQQWADAADACEAQSSVVSTSATVVDLNATVHAGADNTAGVANGVTLSGLDPSVTYNFTLPTGETYTAYSVWGEPDIDPGDPQTGSYHRFRVAIDGSASNVRLIGRDTLYDGYEAARAAFTGASISGASSLVFFISDTPIFDNTGGLSIRVAPANAWDGVWRCDGLVVVEDRELTLIEPVLACMAGTLDTTGGLLGVRAGVWVAPTVTLTEPIGDEIDIEGASDQGYDTVRAKFLGRHRDWQETDGPGYALRSGSRIRPLHLSLVREPEQAARLEKIAALRDSPRRRVTATWDGREAERRVGERVTFSLSGQPRVSGTYRVESKQFAFSQEADGLRVETRLTLVEDREAFYTWAGSDYTPPAGYEPPNQSTPEIAAPTGCELAVIEQPGQWTEGQAQLYIRHRWLPVEGADTYDVEIYTQPYSVGDNDFGDTTQRLLIPADQTIDDSGTTKVQHVWGPVVSGVEYRFRVWARSAGLGQSDSYLECSITVSPPSAVLGSPEVVSFTHDGANTATHTIRAPNFPGVTFLRLSAGDLSDRSDLVSLGTVPIGPLGEHAFQDVNAFAKRYLRAVAIDQYGREGTALDYDYTPGSAVADFVAMESSGIVLLEDGASFVELE